jgi:GNAT superfamily N-acetyltransferase
MSVSIRSAQWPEDGRGISAIHVGYVTDRVYRLRSRAPLGFELIEERVDPPFVKSYRALAERMGVYRAAALVLVAEEDGRLVGVAAANVDEWSGRAQVEDVFVDQPARGRGVGRALMEAIVAFARGRGCWCVWLETQAENYPAIQFYQRLGFRLCGFDTHLYDPRSEAGGETAVFLALDL